MDDLKQELEAIKARNARVEKDKAWETSWTRRLFIALGTYIIAAFYFSFLKVDPAWLHGAVPAGAYLISTFSLPLLKDFWAEKIHKN